MTKRQLYLMKIAETIFEMKKHEDFCTTSVYNTKRCYPRLRHFLLIKSEEAFEANLYFPKNFELWHGLGTQKKLANIVVENQFIYKEKEFWIYLRCDDGIYSKVIFEALCQVGNFKNCQCFVEMNEIDEKIQEKLKMKKKGRLHDYVAYLLKTMHFEKMMTEESGSN